MNGDASYSNLGGEVTGKADVDGDGVDDILVGAPYADTNGTNSGTLKVISGASLIEIFELVGDSQQDRFGSEIVDLGDLDGDGYDEFAVRSDGDDNNGIDSGSVKIISLGRDWDNDGVPTLNDNAPLVNGILVLQ